jgi:FkbM family methyltransferase
MSKLSRFIQRCRRLLRLPDLFDNLEFRTNGVEKRLEHLAEGQANLIGTLAEIERQLNLLAVTMEPPKQIDSLRFYGQFAPPVDRFIFSRYFPDKNIAGVCVESGAFDGVTESSCKFFEETMGWESHNVEPMPSAFERLLVNRPKSKNYNFAFSNRCGKSVFRQVSHPDLGLNFGNSSLSHTATHLQDLVFRGCRVLEIEVTTLTWRDWIEEEGISFVDLMVLDVEGHEIQVIEGMEGCSVLPDVVCVEIGHLDFSKIRQKLSALGYVYDVTSHVNAFFVKRDRLGLFAIRTKLGSGQTKE